MIADFRLAVRGLVKSPGFTIIAVLTLALGIGANSAIFSVIDTVLLRPLPFPKSQELVAVWSKADEVKQTQSFPDYLDLREQAQSLASMTAFTQAGAILGNGQDSREVSGLAITSDVFPVFGVQPFLGRAFTRAEDSPDSHVVVLTYELWQRSFNSDPNVIGREILLSLRPYTVIGVMPRGFRYPVGSTLDYLMPLHPLVAKETQNRGSHFLRLVGRLQQGATVAGASAEINAIAARLAQQFPDTNTGRSGYAVSLRDDIVGNVRAALCLLLAAVFLVLLIACANVANLLLARATSRRREIAIRTALGARRFHVVRQLLAEGCVLAFLGGAGGLFLAWWGVDLLRLFGPQDVPRLDEVHINSAVVFFTFGAAICSTLLFATIPALQVSRPNVNESLQEGNRGASGPESHRLRALLVVSQVALSILLLVGAGLLIKSFGKLSRTNPGFDPTRVITAEISLPRVEYSETPKQRQFFEELFRRLQALPGVESVGGASPLAFSGNDRGTSFWINGRPDPGPGNHPDASHLSVDGDYFRTMRIPLLAGRIFSARDRQGSASVVLINDALAHKFFPHQSPIGERLRIDTSDGKPDVREVIGVVGSTRHESLATAPVPEFYVAAAQDPTRRLDLVLRTSSATLSGVENSVRATVHELDGDVYVPSLQPLQNLIGTTLAQPRFNTVLLGSFASVAMILAAIGIYGVIAYSVAQRTHEIGIRMALGGQRRDILLMIMQQSFRIIGVGLVAGLLAALVSTRLMNSLLYGVSAYDFSIYGIVLFVLAFASLVATFVPARRAIKVDPMVALRHE